MDIRILPSNIANMIAAGEVVGECPLIAESDEPENSLLSAIKYVLRNWLLSFNPS